MFDTLHRSQSPGLGSEYLKQLRAAVPVEDTALETKRRSVLLVDALPEHRFELRDLLHGAPYRVLEARGRIEALDLLSAQDVDLVLASMELPDGGGIALCSVLRHYFQTAATPIFLLANHADEEQEAQGLAAGADDFLSRPYSPAVFLARIEAAMRRRRKLESLDNFESVLLSLAQAVEARDPATGRHCQRVAAICSTLGIALNLSPEDLATLQRGAFLHDIGKIAVPDHILFKRGSLSPEEWLVMKDHTTYGERICSGIRSLHSVLPIIRSHHERWDGSGYPDGLHTERIPLLARVLQIADIFDALTTDRPYKTAFTPEHALKILKEESEAGWRDPKVMEAFCRSFGVLRDLDAISNSSLAALSQALGSVGPKKPVSERHAWSMLQDLSA